MKRTNATTDASGCDDFLNHNHGAEGAGLVFTGGQLPRTREGTVLTDEPIEVQTRQVLENIRWVLEEAGLTIHAVLTVTIFLEGLDSAQRMDDAYSEYFQDNPPAWSVIEVSRLPLDADIEIEAIAAKRR